MTTTPARIFTLLRDGFDTLADLLDAKDEFITSRKAAAREHAAQVMSEVEAIATAPRTRYDLRRAAIAVRVREFVERLRIGLFRDDDSVDAVAKWMQHFGNALVSACQAHSAADRRYYSELADRARSWLSKVLAA